MTIDEAWEYCKAAAELCYWDMMRYALEEFTVDKNLYQCRGNLRQWLESYQEREIAPSLYDKKCCNCKYAEEIEGYISRNMPLLQKSIRQALCKPQTTTIQTQ